MRMDAAHVPSHTRHLPSAFVPISIFVQPRLLQVCSDAQLADHRSVQLSLDPYTADNFTTLSNAMRDADVQWIDVLKIDVEGSHGLCVPNMQASPSAIVIQLHSSLIHHDYFKESTGAEWPVFHELLAADALIPISQVCAMNSLGACRFKCCNLYNATLE